MSRSRFAAFLMLPGLCLALDDLPVYLDAGCDAGKTTGGLNNGYAQGPSGMVLGTKANGDKTIPVTCTDAVSGSDAIVVNLPRKLASGEYWDFGVKFADDRVHGIKAFKDVHVWIKNKAATAAKLRVGWEAVSGNGTMKVVEIPAGDGWKEYVWTLQELPGDSVRGFKLSQPTDQYGGADTQADPIDILVDSIVLTDGTGAGALKVPTVLHNPVPSNWGDKFLLGSFDNREVGKSTKAAQAGMPYRYQYVMPETIGYYSRSGTGYIYDYAMESESLGVKTAIVWYNLGKVGEGWDPVTKNLGDATYMNNYFVRYDSLLNMLARAGQSDYMIICEPDMYGFLMRGPDGATGTPVSDPTIIKVDMTKANALSGKTYASNMVGWAQYLVARARQKLPKGVIIGHMPNHWGVSIPGQVGQGRKESHYISALTIGTFLSAFGKEGMGDVVFVEKSDHDAGHKPSNEDWLWDSTNYAKYFLWTRTIAWKTGLPICGWQVSEGNMGNKKEWQDDAAETFLAHPDWWVDGAFTGILFGAGNSDCVNYGQDLDGGWFVDHMGAYMKGTQVSLVPTGVKPRSAKPLAGLQCVRSEGGLLLSGWQGEAEVVVSDLSGRILSQTRLHEGSVLPLRGSAAMRVVRVHASGLDAVRIVPAP